MKLVRVYVFFMFCILCSFGWLVNASTIAEYYTNMKMNSTNEVRQSEDYEEFPDYQPESIIDNNKKYDINNKTNETDIKEKYNETGVKNITDIEKTKDKNKTNEFNNNTSNNVTDISNKNDTTIDNQPFNPEIIITPNKTKTDSNLTENIPNNNQKNNETNIHINPTEEHYYHPSMNNITLNDNKTSQAKPHHKKKKTHINKLNKKLTNQIFEQFLKYTNQLISEKQPSPKDQNKNDTSTIIITSSTNTTINTNKESTSNSHNIISIKSKHHRQKHLRSF